MASITAFTAERMKQIEDTTVVGGLVDPTGRLLLTTREGVELDAGYVKGPPGDPGEQGEDGLQGSVAIPAGTISLWASDVAPVNWMICDGSAISRTQYASLFDAIGIKYGAGDGVNTFNLPNLKGRTPVGKDATQTEFDVLGETGGAKTHTLTLEQIPAHAHALSSKPAGSGYTFGQVGGVDASSNFGTVTTDSRGGGLPHNILQPYTVVNFIIKVTAGETPGDSELATRLSALESNFSGTPAGTMTMWPASVAPTNWLICDGAAVSRTTYASLFSAIGTQYGVGDGSTTFNLPNLKGRIAVGRDAAQTEFDVLGETGGAKTHTLTTAEMPSHTHPQNVTANTNGTALRNDYSADAAGGTYAQGVNTGATGGGGAHNNLQPYQVVNYIIKITNGDTKGDSQLTGRVSAIEAGTTYGLQVREKVKRAQATLHGGGVRKVLDGHFSWGSNFRAMGIGQDALAPGGYFNITMPPDGTVIPVHGHPTVTSITVGTPQAGKISVTTMSGYAALYYDLPIGSTFASQPSRFHLVDYTAGQFTIPETWILIAMQTIDGGTPQWKWGDGRTQDYWHDLAFINSWSNYAAGYSLAGYKRISTGEIVLRGLIKGGTGAIMSVSTDRPGPDYVMIFNQQASGAYARIDVQVDGTALVSTYAAGANNGWVSLEGIRWFPAGS